MSYPRIPGHQLSVAEVLEFWKDTDGPSCEYVLDTACQVAPGVPVRGGYWTGQRLLKLSNGDILVEVPDDSVPHDFGQLTYWGSDVDQGQLRDLLVNFVVDNHLEVFIAFALEFRSERFAEYANELLGCQQHFRVEWNLFDHQQREAVSVELSRRSEPYRIVVEFFSNPFDPKFRGILDQAVNEKQFGLVYQLAKDI